MKEIGILIVHDNTELSNQVFSDANQAWFDVPEGLRGLQYHEPLWVNVAEMPDNPIIEQAEITTVPTVLFVETEGDRATMILSRLEGNVGYERIYKRYVAHLENPGAIWEGEGKPIGSLISLDRVGYWLGFGLIDLGLGAWFNIFILIILILILYFAAKVVIDYANR